MCAAIIVNSQKARFHRSTSKCDHDVSANASAADLCASDMNTRLNDDGCALRDARADVKPILDIDYFHRCRSLASPSSSSSSSSSSDLFIYLIFFSSLIFSLSNTIAIQVFRNNAPINRQVVVMPHAFDFAANFHIYLGTPRACPML